MGNINCKKNDIVSSNDIEHIESIQFAIRNLETQRIMKLKKIEEENYCEICFNNPKNLAFVLCGHVVCNECGFLPTMNECPFCRKTIEYKLILYM
jgi:hypothetical protein